MGDTGSDSTAAGSGSIAFNRKDKLGRGGQGTVFRGKHNDREVAVKLIPLENMKAIKREVNSLINLDQHPNVIRYYHKEKKDGFCCIALELADGNLEDYVKRTLHFPKTSNISIIAQATEGLKWLHSKKILHRDIKPSNILLVNSGTGGMVTKLSDFGLSKKLSNSKEAASLTGGGTLGWMAPEILSNIDKHEPTRACDVFALGCVIFYVLTKGKHPFGDDDIDRGSNIKHDKYILSAVEDVTSKSLVEDMIQHEPKKRPSAAAVLGHPFFWEQHTKISFIQDVSDRAKSDKDKVDNKKDKNDIDKQASPLCISLEEDTHLVFHGTKSKPDSWKARLGDAIGAGLDISLKKEKDMQNKTTKKGYDDSAAGLLRLIRNKMHHFEEVPEEARIVVGKTKEEFMEYITKEIPCLVLYVWRAAFELKEDSGFKKYYQSKFKFSLHISKMEKIDLMGSEIDWQSLKKLVLENKEHLKDLALPNDCSNEQLEMLLGHLQSLEKLTVQNPQGTGQWLQWLPRTMETLDISGPDGSEMEWNLKGESQTVTIRHATDSTLAFLADTGLKKLIITGLDGSEMEWDQKGESPTMTIRHATDSTLALLTGLGDRLQTLIITESPLVTASGLLHVGRLTKLEVLTLQGVPAGVITDAGRDGPEDTGRLFQKLPESLETLVISGPDGSEMKWNLKGLPRATIRHATDSTLVLLTGLADRLKKLTITESPLVTASGLLHVGRLTELKWLYLRGVPAGSITDAVLDGLNSCSRLRELQLGDIDQPQETAITAAAVCRLAVACRELRALLIHTTADSSQAVLDGLHRTDLGSDSDGDPRTIWLVVPDRVYRKLREPPSGSRIEVRRWW